MIKYKILDTATGLYSHGGYDPNWSGRGKSWDSWKSVISYLKTYRSFRRYKIPTSWEVVEFLVTLTKINRTPVKDVLGDPSHFPITLHVSGADICRTKNSKKQKSESRKKTGKRLKG